MRTVSLTDSYAPGVATFNKINIPTAQVSEVGDSFSTD